MSRTYRTRKPTDRLGWGTYPKKFTYKNGTVSDAERAHGSAECQNHGWCLICQGNRLHKNRRREPILLA